MANNKEVTVIAKTHYIKQHVNITENIHEQNYSCRVSISEKTTMISSTRKHSMNMEM